MSHSVSLSGIQACVFDAYGTLFDVHSAVAAHRMRLGEKAEGVSSQWRTKQLEYTWLRSLMGHHADFWQVTAEALDYALASYDTVDPGLRSDLLDAYLRLDGYPEVADTLRNLKNAGIRCAILSNGSPQMLAAAADNAGLSELLDAVWSVEDVGVFKPAPQVYRLATTRFDLRADQIAFMSSNGWDCAGAAAFGLRVVWVNRFGQKPERLPFGPEAELRSLSDLPRLLGF